MFLYSFIHFLFFVYLDYLFMAPDIVPIFSINLHCKPQSKQQVKKQQPTTLGTSLSQGNANLASRQNTWAIPLAMVLGYTQRQLFSLHTQHVFGFFEVLQQTVSISIQHNAASTSQPKHSGQSVKHDTKAQQVPAKGTSSLTSIWISS